VKAKYRVRIASTNKKWPKGVLPKVTQNERRLPDRGPRWQDTCAYLTVAAKGRVEIQPRNFGNIALRGGFDAGLSSDLVSERLGLFGRSSGRNFSGSRGIAKQGGDPVSKIAAVRGFGSDQSYFRGRHLIRGDLRPAS
jgi:hypothetical protein